jgi:hypothetical protein
LFQQQQQPKSSKSVPRWLQHHNNPTKKK